jgi:mRNA interferase MazF
MDRGEIYLGPFLYSDLAGSKRRPMCVLSGPRYSSGPDVMVAMISSGSRVESPLLGDVVLRDWQSAGLLRPSVVRTGRLQVMERRLLSTLRGALSQHDLERVNQALRDVLELG